MVGIVSTPTRTVTVGLFIPPFWVAHEAADLPVKVLDTWAVRLRKEIIRDHGLQVGDTFGSGSHALNPAYFVYGLGGESRLAMLASTEVEVYLNTVSLYLIFFPIGR